MLLENGSAKTFSPPEYGQIFNSSEFSLEFMLYLTKVIMRDKMSN